jgi:excisionase family DNA binding protein
MITGMSDANDPLATAIAALVAATRATSPQASAPPQTLLTVDEAAEKLRVSRSLIYGQMRDGRLRGIKIGRRRLIPASEVERLIRGAAA